MPDAVPHWHAPEAAAPSRPLTLARGPRTLYIETSNRCNSLWQTCPLTFYGSPGGAHDLGFEEFRAIVDQAPDLERVGTAGPGWPATGPGISPTSPRAAMSSPAASPPSSPPTSRPSPSATSSASR